MQEYWSGLPFPSPGDLPDPGMELVSLVSPSLQSRVEGPFRNPGHSETRVLMEVCMFPTSVTVSCLTIRWHNLSSWVNRWCSAF